MNDYIVMYFKLLEWIVLNPAPAMVFLLVEFSVMYWVYYKFKENIVLKVIFGILFIPQNFVFNMTAMTLIGLGDIPREGASTSRAKRWKQEYVKGTGKVLTWPAPKWVMEWRNNFAFWICGIMNKADPGHC
jgi:hypothetical protein